MRNIKEARIGESCAKSVVSSICQANMFSYKICIISARVVSNVQIHVKYIVVNLIYLNATHLDTPSIHPGIEAIHLKIINIIKNNSK